MYNVFKKALLVLFRVMILQAFLESFKTRLGTSKGLPFRRAWFQQHAKKAHIIVDFFYLNVIYMK